MAIFIGSVDFYDGDFELKHIEADNIIDAERKLRRYVVANYGRYIKEIDQISVQTLRYCERAIQNAGK